jgi:hypothetical protein
VFLASAGGAKPQNKPRLRKLVWVERREAPVLSKRERGKKRARQDEYGRAAWRSIRSAFRDAIKACPRESGAGKTAYPGPPKTPAMNAVLSLPFQARDKKALFEN